MKKNLILILALALPACSAGGPAQVIDKKAPAETKKTSQLNLPVSQDNNRPVKIIFKTQSTALSRIKSFDAFLTTNFTNPFAPGANPFGDNVRQQVNNNGAEVVLNFNNLPAGGPYYAVIAAYDNIVGSARNNITLPDNTLSSTDKKWARSINSVITSLTGNSFSDASGELKIELKLNEFNNIGFIVTPQSGPLTTGPVTVSQ